MTKLKALALGTVIAINAIGFIAVHWWLVSLIALLAAGYCFRLFVSKFRRDRRFAMRSRALRSLPQEDTPLSTPGSDGLFVPPPFE